MVKMRERFDSLIDVLEKKAWLKRTWGGAGVAPYEDTARTGAYTYRTRPITYADCEGLCALGVIDEFLGALYCNQSITYFDEEELDALSKPVDERLLDWWDSILVNVGQEFAHQIFMKWKFPYFKQAIDDGRVHYLTVKSWTTISACNDAESTVKADMLDLLGVIDLYPPFQEVKNLTRMPTSKKLALAKPYYKKQCKPETRKLGYYAPEMGYLHEVNLLEIETHIRLLREANIL